MPIIDLCDEEAEQGASAHADVASSDEEAWSPEEASSHEDVASFAHAGEGCRPGDALFRALLGVAYARHSLSQMGAGARKVSVPDMIANGLAICGRQTERKRESDLLCVQEDQARKYLVAKRMSEGMSGWAKSWARREVPEKCGSPKEVEHFLRNVRRYAARLPRCDPKPASSQQLRSGITLAPGLCTTGTPPSKRRRRLGAGGPGVMKCAVVGEELFAWFVDSIHNVRGRLPSFCSSK